MHVISGYSPASQSSGGLDCGVTLYASPRSQVGHQRPLSSPESSASTSSRHDQPELAQEAECHNFSRKDLMPAIADHLWQIQQGFVRTLTWDEDGTVITLGLWGVGDLVGRSLSRLQPYQLECLTAVAACPMALPLSQADQLLFSHVQQMEQLLCMLQCKSVERRLWQLLQWLAQRFGCHTEQGWLINLPLTHQEMAETIGTTRVTITRLLNQFEHDGRLQRCTPGSQQMCWRSRCSMMVLPQARN